MKKNFNVIALLLAIFMLLPSFAACGTQNAQSGDELYFSNSASSENAGKFDYLVGNGNKSSFDLLSVSKGSGHVASASQELTVDHPTALGGIDGDRDPLPV